MAFVEHKIQISQQIGRRLLFALSLCRCLLKRERESAERGLIIAV